MMHFGVIGHGVIAETLLSGIVGDGSASIGRIVCLARPGSEDRAAALLDAYRSVPERQIVTSIDAFVTSGISLAAECAGQQALCEFGERVLAAGIDLVPASVGALADDELHTRLMSVAKASGAIIFLPAGAVGGLDIVGAAKLSGIETVLYTSRKPPLAWQGTPAEQLIDLSKLTRPTTFYDGTARAAARDYPKNANVAAAVALAGIGFDRTKVQLVADPSVERNVHEIVLRSSCADVTMRIEGRPSPKNPQTSLTAGFSIARLVLSQMANEVI